MVHSQFEGEEVENCENSEFQQMSTLWWCAAKRGERDVTRAFPLYVCHWESAGFWLVENVINEEPPTWACVPLFKQKPKSKNGEVYTLETSCMKGTSLHIRICE